MSCGSRRHGDSCGQSFSPGGQQSARDASKNQQTARHPGKPRTGARWIARNLPRSTGCVRVLADWPGALPVIPYGAVSHGMIVSSWVGAAGTFRNRRR